MNLSGKTEKKDAQQELEKANNEYKKDTGHPLADRAFYWFIDLYNKRGKRFGWSEALVYKFWTHQFPTIAGYIAFFFLFLWLGSIWIEKYGPAQAIIIFMMLIMWRLQILASIMNQLNKKM